MRTKMNIAVLISLLASVLILVSPCYALSDDILPANDPQGNSNPTASSKLSDEIASELAADEEISAAEQADATPVKQKAGKLSPLTQWEKLQPMSTDKLTAMLSKTNDPIESAWIQLALISKDRITDEQKMITALLNWRDENPDHPANVLLPASNVLDGLQNESVPHHIAVLLPERGSFAAAAKTVHDGFMNAYKANHLENKQTVAFYDTAGQHNIADVYKQAVEDGADFIVGPLTKADVASLNKLAPFDVPVLALNYSNSPNVDDNFYEFGLLPEDDATQIAWRAHAANLAHALVIAPNDPWGKRLTAAFAKQWTHLGGTIQENWYFNAKTDFNTGIPRALGINVANDEKLSKIKNNMQAQEQQRRQDIDVIILFSQAKQATLIVPLLSFYYAGNLPVYSTSAVFAHNTVSNHDLNKVIVCDVPQGFQTSSRNTFNNKLYAMGQDAYHLSQSIQRLAVLPHFPVYSATGALVIDDKQQVHRRLPCVSIKNLIKSHSQYASNA